jgi:TnpA family transposase
MQASPVFQKARTEKTPFLADFLDERQLHTRADTERIGRHWSRQTARVKRFKLFDLSIVNFCSLFLDNARLRG